MSNFIGIDLGTSSVKILLTDERGKILASSTRPYDVYRPQEGWSEQDPEEWFQAVLEGLEELNARDVAGISFGGQMHGLVALDREGKVIRPCILWNDGRTDEETAYLNETVGREKLNAWTGNIAFAGFTAPKLLWMYRHEPENFAKIDKILLPKDYLAYRFTGEFSTDYSDASGTLLLDVKNRCWSEEMCEICHVSKEQLPALHESYEVIGTMKRSLADALGYGEVKVCAGAGDNAAAAVGMGVVGEGGCNVSLGTSGTLFLSSDSFSDVHGKPLHSFCHADGKYHLMGCILSAASCNEWWVHRVLRAEDYAAEQAGLEKYLGDNDVFFLPYLAGERCPHNDVTARGAFIGLNAESDRGQMTLAVLEGVAFALRDCLEEAKACGRAPQATSVCGGGARSELWVRVLSNVLGISVCGPKTTEGPAYGAAMLAMVGCGVYRTVDEAARAIVRVLWTREPEPELVARYEKKYQKYKQFYPALKGLF